MILLMMFETWRRRGSALHLQLQAHSIYFPAHQTFIVRGEVYVVVEQADASVEFLDDVADFNDLRLLPNVRADDVHIIFVVVTR